MGVGGGFEVLKAHHSQLASGSLSLAYGADMSSQLPLLPSCCQALCHDDHGLIL